MSLFPRFVSHDFPRIVNSDFAPVWRLLDDYANQVVSARHELQSPPQSRSFNPRFDVQESAGAYELKGELPGVEQSNIEIEFPDQQTVVVKGTSGYAREGGRPQAVEAQQTVEETPSETSSHHATVEDEPEIINADGETVASPEPAVVQAPKPAATTQATQTPKSRYWISERSTGSFQRTFTFPAPVDTENTKAKLRDGILDIVIPKIPKAGIKRIAVE